MRIKFNSKLLLVFLYFLIFIFIAKPASATDYINDQFNSNSLDSSIWSIYNENNNSILSGGYLNVSIVDFYRAMYIQSVNPLPTDEKLKFEISFKYNSFSFGSGIAITDTLPHVRQLNNHPDLSDWTIFLWPTGPDSFKVFSVDCPATGTCLPSDNPLFSVSGIDAYLWHKLVVIYDGTKYIVKFDDLEAKSTIPTSRKPKYLWFGNPMITQGTSFSTFSVDYVRVSTYEPAPTFPYLSQLDSRWKNEEYDSASKWAGIDKYGIGRWGCALTSAAMVLQKNGVKALDGTDIDPSKLNAWLKSQPDGYVGLGYLNWVAITRYVRLSYDARHSPTKLEFTRTGAVTFPSIIGLPGHFVVVHGEDGSNWLVNDPASNTITTLPKSTALSSVNTFVPSMTDLSYMMFSTSPAVNVKIMKEHKKDLQIDWKDEQITDPTTGDKGPINKIGLVPKPNTDEYELKVTNSSDKPEIFEIYLYDKQGNPYIKKMTLGKKSNIKFEIKYNKDNLNKMKIEHEKKYRYEWNNKKKWLEKIWDEHDRWEERSKD
jgi:hypothetical protein